MLRTIHKTTVLAAAGLAVVMVAQAAGAAMITQWDYTINSGFSNAKDGNGHAIDFNSGGPMTASGSDGYFGDYTQITATDGQNRSSSIKIDGDVSGSGLTTNGDSVAGATFTHNNNVIDLGTNGLRSFTIDTNLSLTSTEPSSESGQTPVIPSLAFESHFIETDNTVGKDNCDVQDGGKPCSDIFVLGNADTLQGGLNSDDDFIISQDFNAGSDGRLYTLFLSIDGLGLLDPDVCEAAGATAGCIGFTTMEDTLNEYTSTLRIVSATSVPEPGTLTIMLLGLGLLGLGFAVRRRNGHQLSV